jgi:acyl dehydratase|tara:strand:+ start:696 stop:1157 length:462 start_codon:yes stop_codon:yes gene_type:complete
MGHIISSFEDLKALEGLEVGVSDWLLISQESINQFANLTHDHQWIHVDVERAKKEMPGGTTIAHGYLTLSMIPAMTAGFLEFTNLKMGINYGLNRVRFTNMVAVDSRIRARSVVKTVRQRSEAIQLIGETSVEIEGESKPACIVETVSFFHLG